MQFASCYNNDTEVVICIKSVLWNKLITFQIQQCFQQSIGYTRTVWSHEQSTVGLREHPLSRSRGHWEHSARSIKSDSTENSGF